MTSDDAYWKNTVNAPSPISQLDQANISWKAYLQALPYPGYEGICYPAKCNGAPDSDPLYVSKHDGIQNYDNNTLILSGTNGAWTVDAGPEPGSGSNILGGITTANGHPWAAGIYDDGGSELPLIEHR